MPPIAYPNDPALSPAGWLSIVHKLGSRQALSFGSLSKETLKLAAGSDGAAYRIRTYDPRITKVIVSRRIYNKYQIVRTVSGRATRVHQVRSQIGEVPDIWVCLFKMRWLSRKLKCDLF